MFKVLRVENKENYKQVHLQAHGYQYTVNVFPDYSGYDQLENGKQCDGYIRIKGHYTNLVDYYKVERNWQEDEKFIKGE